MVLYLTKQKMIYKFNFTKIYVDIILRAHAHTRPQMFARICISIYE